MKFSNPKKAFLCLKIALLSTAFIFLSVQVPTHAQDTLFASVGHTTTDSTAAGDTTLFWHVNFKVDTSGTNGNASGGWIVQKITATLKVYMCPENNGAEPASESTTRYYEVWPVPAGTDSTTISLPDGTNDMFRFQAWAMPPETYGTFKMVGEVAFVSNPGGGTPATPGDDGGPDTNRTASGGSNWGAGKVPNAGTLISTYNKPSFWDALVASGKVSTRTWSVSWNKCTDRDAVDDRDPEDVVDRDGEGGRDEGEEGGGRKQEDRPTLMDGNPVKFYPNPATRELTVYGADYIKTTIYTANGNVVLESTAKQIDLRDLHPGIYIILLSNGNETVKDLLIIQ